MYKKYLYIIPLFFLELMIQLGFFWLAPNYKCKWIVYAFITIMTIAHFVLTFLLASHFGIRKAAATIAAGSAVQIIVLVAGVFLLAANASVRNSVFFMLMVSALYLAIVTIFGFSIEESETIVERADKATTAMTKHGDGGGEITVRNTVQGTNNVRTSLVSDNSSGRRTPPPLPTRH